MTVMIPLTVQNDYTELKYCLRSIDKYLPDVTEVVIVGDNMPEWITNVTQIELPNVKSKAQLSVRRKILAALEYTSSFAFFNDDIYLLKPTTFPYYSKGDLKANSLSGAKPLQDELKALDKPTNNFELHYPLIINQDFKEIIKHFSDDCLNRSAYCNYKGINGINISDCKIINQTSPEKIKSFIKDKPCLSTGVNSIQSALPVLQELFTEPSKFEI